MEIRQVDIKPALNYSRGKYDTERIHVKIFVSGGTGLVGRHIITSLQQRGDQVLCLTRDKSMVPADFPAEVEIIEGNSVVPGKWQEAIASCDGVINLAGESVAEGFWTKGKKRRIRRSRLSTTFNIVDALEERDRPAVLVSASATGYYGDAGPQALTEKSEPGHGFLARLACEWEHTTRQAEAEQVRVAMIRIGVVLSDEGGALTKMLPAYRMGLGGPMGNGSQYFPWIHINDLVRVFLFALDNPEISGPVNASVPTPPQQKEFAAAMGRALDKPAFLPTPALALRLLLGEKASIVLSSQRVVPNVLKAAGFKFQNVDLDDVLAEFCH